MRFSGLNTVMRQSTDYMDVIRAMEEQKLPCQVHGLSESQKAYISYCLFEDRPAQVLIITHNEMEAKKLYDDIRVFTEECFYFPIKEMVFNVDVTSGEIKTERLHVIREVLTGRPLIVVSSVDALFYRMPPADLFRKAPFTLTPGDMVDILELSSRLINLGYEHVELVEGKGQFAQRGGIVDIFPAISDEPVRIEFFGDEIDTIRVFDTMSQRSQNKIQELSIYPAREVILNSEDIMGAIANMEEDLERRLKTIGKKSQESGIRLKERVRENIEKLKNMRYFDGIDSYMGYIYEDAASFMEYMKNPVVIVDESSRVLHRIQNAFEEFSENYKSMLEKGDLLPRQAEYMYTTERILDGIRSNSAVYMNMLPRSIEEMRPRSIVNFNAITMNPLSGNIEYLYDEIRLRVKKQYKVLILAGTSARAERLVEALKEISIPALYKDKINELSAGTISVTFGSLSRGMEFPDIKLSIISDREVFKEKKEKKKTFTKKSRKIESFTDIKAGDYVVHVNHGIGVFKGINELMIEGVKKDYLILQYNGGDTLYVPVEQLDMVQKYIGNDEAVPKVSKLGGNEWSKAKNKVKDSLKEMAEDLVKLYAQRSTLNGHAFSRDTHWQKQFEEEFPYEETPDQLNAIVEIKQDMEQSKPMDRLLCGDVGYGKTEVAIRAAFKAVMDGKQVAVLVPTTILAEQHYNNFKQRFVDFPITIEMLSRFRTGESQRKTLKALSSGNVDVIVGTHKLLQKDIRYKDLGLLVIDEEQRFGVSHKEKIKAMKKNIDVLTLTATPIPRTLHMSMIGVRDMSIIETPPEERFPVQTYVMEYNDGIIRDAIIREISRGGQVFFVYNRVESIRDMQLTLAKLVPEAKIVVGHGQLNEKELEEVILDFIGGEGDILLCTTIIETGIDIPNVNTLIVYEADKMGLSQLYQLRGRVGRSTRLAYAYFTYKKDKILTEVAEKRLKAIKEFTEFGSGFKIAMRDLEIRGAGNLLGTQQHGHMSVVGYDLYCRLLEESIREIRGDEEGEYIETSIELSVNAYIPGEYIEDEVLKIEIYKKIASIAGKEDKMDMEEELVDRFGDIPDSVENLINIAYVKSVARTFKVVSIRQLENEVMIQFKTGDSINLEKLREANSRMNNAIGFGSTKLPIIKLRVDRLSHRDPIRGLREMFEIFGSLQS